jgi:hypothetical protein
MEEQPSIEDIPQIDKEETDEEELTGAKKIEQQLSDSFQAVSRKLKETVNIDLFLPDIHDWIFSKLKQGPTLIIGERIGKFAERLVENEIKVVARESSVSYVSPKTEVKNNKILEKLEMKPFIMEKISNISDTFLNIIIIFALKRLSREDQEELLLKCKRILAKDGQMIVVGEYYPKSPFLMPIFLTKEGFKTIKNKVFRKNVARPLTQMEKLADKLELKFFDVKEDAGGRIRTYVFTKRWGALIT